MYLSKVNVSNFGQLQLWLNIKQVDMYGRDKYYQASTDCHFGYLVI